jgi:hypothetical protein
MDWYQVKDSLERAMGLHMDALHIYAGMLIQLLVALLLRRSLASPWPLLAVLIAAAANEYHDFAYEVWPQRGIQVAEGFKDGWNTLLLPTALMLLTRFAPRLFDRQAKPVRRGH